MENNNEDRRISDETVQRLAEVVYTALRKSAVDLGAEFPNRWMSEIDVKLLEGASGLFSEILKEVADGVYIDHEDVGDASGEMWVFNVRSRQMDRLQERLVLGVTQIESKKYTVRIVPAADSESDAVKMCRYVLRDPCDLYDAYSKRGDDERVAVNFDAARSLFRQVSALTRKRGFLDRRG